MTHNDHPTVLVTRPAAASSLFVDRLRAAAGPFDAVISPAFELVEVDHGMPHFDAAVFTSRAGVFFAPDGNGKSAWCVGDSTARAAQDKGYVVQSANGASADLVAMILDQNPSNRLLHIRGENTLGDVTELLGSAGINCDEVVVYKKSTEPPTPAALGLNAAERDIIVPLFSAETVSIMAHWGLRLSGCRAVAMSDYVAAGAAVLSPSEITICDAPNLGAMTQATAALIA